MGRTNRRQMEALMPISALAVRALITGVFHNFGLTPQEAEFAFRVAQRESSLGQNIEPHADPDRLGNPGTSLQLGIAQGQGVPVFGSAGRRQRTRRTRRTRQAVR